MPTMNISLTPELMKIVQAKVEGGLYNNASEVIRDALRQLESNAEMVYAFKLEQLKKALEPGVKQAKRREFVEFPLEKALAALNSEK